MAFEQVEVHFAKAGPRSPAAVTLYRHANSDKPAGTAISLRADIVSGAGFTPESTFNLLIGRDDDAGKLRLVAAKDGSVRAVFMKRTNAFFVRLGWVAAIGSEPCARTETTARIIQKGTVEVDIPNLGAVKLLAPPSKSDDDAPAASGDRASPANGDEIFLNGITIDLTDENETITFDGEGIAVSTLEAQLVKILARPRPAPVSESFIISNLWEKPAPKNASEQLRQLCVGDLKGGLAKIGLNLNLVKGAGYQLKDR